MSVLVIAAHPDDELIGACEILRRLTCRNARIELVHVTDGAPIDMIDARRAGFVARIAYAAARRAELAAALAVSGIAVRRAWELKIVDQHAWRDLVDLTRRIASLVERCRPRAIITHPYEGGHPDHDSTAFAVRQAVATMTVRSRRASVPVIVEMTSYHAGREGMRTNAFLPAAGDRDRRAASDDADGYRVDLDRIARARKRRALGCFRTQAETLRAFPLGPERLRVAPEYVFTTPPHDGPLWYERFPWGTTGAAWREAARRALAELQQARA